ncbi:CBASS cGAMP-activated phospholipase [Mesorhizobium sp.]|uniref:CBASS cGAMP-activated phospholipase n=1 Tax=Mesorhizobium sp. TaxID=1871066 RepID=UPI000FD4E4B6|nr:CBASS cGAMP-activated phospholipase [Mesorhizobium sp.]RVC63978.1 patatin [Mesorhizobium sp. M4B.F.Ca.ET.088.02.2.1]RWF32433.1 MAG: patatin [Mesorhizobium sp.]
MAVESDESGQKFYKVLSIDGGGIRGVFPAAFLARLQEHLDQPIASYFDLIAGTSTGGIIALGLGLRVPIADILRLYEQEGPRIFDQHRGPLINWMVQRARSAKQYFCAKYDSEALRTALENVLANKRLGDSQSRLLVPSWNAETGRVYIYKTAHHPRLESDYKRPAIDAAMATAAAPTFLAPYLTRDDVELIDGGVWANNPTGTATVEGIGMLGWPADRIKILSIGTISSPIAPPKRQGLFAMLSNNYVTQLFMAGQHHSSMGAAMILTGHPHSREAIWRVDQTAPEGRFTLDSTKRIAQMKERGNVEARERLPALRQHFFDRIAAPFEPFHKLEALHETR